MIPKNYLSNFILFIGIFIVCLYFYLDIGIYADFKVLFTNLMIVLISLIFMFYGDKYNYSLNKMFMLFSFFFFGIAPLLQYKFGVVFWGGSPFSDDDFVRINIIILLILIVYQFVYFFFSKVEIKRSSFNILVENKAIKKRTVSSLLLLIMSVLSLIITLYVNNFSLDNLFLRSGDEEVEKVNLDSSFYLIYSNFIRPIPVISLVIFKFFGRSNKKIELFLLFTVLISNFPFARARFYVAAMYIPLLIIYLKQINKRYMLLNKIVIIGLLVIFPFLDQMRRIKNISDIHFSLDFKMFLQGHFDSYQMFLRAIQSDFITLGKQLLGSLFFFIPRSIWPDKPVGSGYQLAHNSGLSFDNVSMNFFGEGYINFGYFGILLFIIVIAFINAKLDKKYWQELNENNYGILSVCYLFFLGLEFFILRGDLLSSFAFTVGILLSTLFVYKLARQLNWIE